MSVLVTGGSGLIGSALCRMLAEEGKMVWIFARRTNLTGFDDIQDRVKIVNGNLANFPTVLDAVKKSAPQVIFHLGAMLSVPSDADPHSALATNVAGTYHILEAARLFNVPKVIFGSSGATYGLDIQKPIINDYTLQRPASIYGTTKLFGELLGRYYRKKYELDFRAIRFPSVIGPGAKTAHVTIFNSWALEKAFYKEPYSIFVEPDIRFPCLYFKDAARSLLQLETAPAESIKMICYLLAGVQPMISAGELVAEIKKHFPHANLDFRPDPFAMDYHRRFQGIIYDDSVAGKEWNWKMRYSLEEMVTDFIAELKNNPGRYH
jgi:nucleoside-diphosphate-sugar epimerase